MKFQTVPGGGRAHIARGAEDVNENVNVNVCGLCGAVAVQGSTIDIAASPAVVQDSDSGCDLARSLASGIALVQWSLPRGY